MKIYIGFSRPKKILFPIFSWLIRLFEWTSYSHVYAYWFSRGGQVNVCYQSSGTSVHFLCDKIFKEKIKTLYLYEIEITSEQYRKLIHFCMSNAGISYGLGQIFGIIYTRFMSLFGLKNVKNPFGNGRKRQVCSELIGSLLEDVVDQSIDLDLDNAGPRDIKNLLDKMDWAKRINN